MNETTKPQKRAARALRRRHVLIGAGAAAGGLAITRVLGLHQAATSMPSSPASMDWISPLDRPQAQVAQLLRRTTFGTTPAELERAASEGYARTVDRLIETPPVEPPVLPGAEEASREKPVRPGELQTWWVDWMMRSPTPFAERMTFFWHGHFTSDFRKVNGQFPYMYWQNLTWRRVSLSKLDDILYQVTIDPAMLRYLDLAQSTGRNPNENYSRELMELFTMGAGTFTEEDVRSGARALSGWREPVTQAMYDAAVKQAMEAGRPAPRNLRLDSVKTGVFEAQRGYAGNLTFLGENRRWDTKSILARILTQETVAPFLVTKVLREFVTDQPAGAQVARLADRFRASGYDMRTLMRDVFTSPEFLEPRAYRALVKSPVEFTLSAAKALESPALARAIVQAGEPMGQALFDPPQVGGWPSNASWISSNSVLARVNFAQATLTGMARIPAFRDAHATHLDSVVSPATAQLLNSSPDDATRWLILLASPEFQLK